MRPVSIACKSSDLASVVRSLGSEEEAEQARAESAAIDDATLLEAAAEVVDCFDRWGVAEELPARVLAAAVGRAS
jgi:hypothetical protein